MEVLTSHIEDIPPISYNCDGTVELAMQHVGLLIGKDNLGNLKVAERPTQRPALPSPRYGHAEASPRQVHAPTSPCCVHPVSSDGEETNSVSSDDENVHPVSSDDNDHNNDEAVALLPINHSKDDALEVNQDVIKENKEGDGNKDGELNTDEPTIEQSIKNESETPSLLPENEVEKSKNLENVCDGMTKEDSFIALDSNMEVATVDSIEIQIEIKPENPDDDMQEKMENSVDESRTNIEDLSIDIRKPVDMESEDLHLSDARSDTQSENYSDNESVASSGNIEEENAQKSDDLNKEPSKTSPSSKKKGHNHKVKLKTNTKASPKIAKTISPLHSPNRRPPATPNRRGSADRLKTPPTKHPSPRDKWKQLATPDVKKKSSSPASTVRKTSPGKSNKDNVSKDDSIQEESSKPKSTEKSPSSSTSSTPRELASPPTANLQVPGEKDEPSIEAATSVHKNDVKDVNDNSVNANDAKDPSTSQAPKYESVHLLKKNRVHLLLQMEQIDAKLRACAEQRLALQCLSTHMTSSSRAAFELKRNNQGVPFVNAVKELIKRKHEEFQEHTGQLQKHQSTLPFYSDLENIFKTFTQVCERIILTTVNYNVTYLEDFHLMAGKLCGMIQSIDTLYFHDYLEESEQYGEQVSQEKTASSIPHSTTELLLGRYERSGPEVVVPHHRGNDDVLKGLETLVDILSHCNECLANIARLSLGNPKNQSLYDTFVVVSGILKGAEPLLEKFVALKLPGVGVLTSSLKEASRIADVSRPGEKQVEELKFALGNCDGQLFMTGKYIFG